MANLKKNHGLTKQLSDDLNFFFRAIITKAMSIYQTKYVPVYTPPKERDFVPIWTS